MSNLGRIQPKLTTSAKPISWELFSESLNKEIPTEIEKRTCLFFGACNLGFNINESDMVTNDGETIITIPATIMGIKQLVENPYPLIEETTENIQSCVEIAKKVYAVAEGLEIARTASPESDPLKEAIMSYVWIMTSNSQYQGDFMHMLVNHLILTGIKGINSLPPDPSKTNTLFQMYTTTPANNYFMILFALWAISTKNFVINTRNFIKEGPKKEMLTHALNKVLEEISFKSNEPIISALFAHTEKYIGKPKFEAILSLRPLIQVSPVHFIVTAHPFMKIQMSKKFLPKALAFARKTENKRKTEYSSYVGTHRFEPFFKELCEIWNPKEGHFDEYEYRLGNNSKSSDRIVFEKHGTKDIAILFQLKNKTLLESTQFGANYESLISDLKHGFAETIHKSISFLYHANIARKNGKLNSQNSAISCRILDSKFCCLVGIITDLPPIFTSKHIRELLMKEVENNLSPEVLKWFREHFEKIVWHIIGLDEFEAFLCIPRTKQKFYKLLTHYFIDSDLENDPISEGSGLPTSFRNYIINRHGQKQGDSRRIKPLPQLKNVFDELMRETSQYFDLKQSEL